MSRRFRSFLRKNENAFFKKKAQGEGDIGTEAQRGKKYRVSDTKQV